MNRTYLSFGLMAALVAWLSAPLAAQEKFGEGVTLKDATPIAALVDDPEAWLGKPVRVDGVVKAVCEEMGCWMELADPATGKSVQFKVDDGVIVFPVSAKGKRASAQGALERVPANEEHEMAGEHPEHAEQAKLTFRVRATGAVIYCQLQSARSVSIGSVRAARSADTRPARAPVRGLQRRGGHEHGRTDAQSCPGIGSFTRSSPSGIATSA